MSRVFRRFASTLPNISATEAAEEILQRFGRKPISIRKQYLDGNQLQLLSLTLGRPKLHNGLSVLKEAPPSNSFIPAGYHLAYFTPSQLEQDLGADGSDRAVNPLAPFTRRMWAGGNLEWNQDPEQMLRVGQTVTEVTKILAAEPKKLKDGNEMILVSVEKQFQTKKGLALVDRRSWVYQKEITKPDFAPRPEEQKLPEGPHTRDFTQTEVSLFRFSALTFNGHKIHYSKEWCQNVEGHRDCVVHGPLNLINMLDLWRDKAGDESDKRVPKSIGYRAMSPLYVNEPYRILLEENHDAKDENGKIWKTEIWDSFGKVAMRGTILE